MFALLGKKIGMTQKFDESGDLIPVTIIKCGPCVVVYKKTKKKEGYEALQLGFEEAKKIQNVNRAQKGHFKKAKTAVFKNLTECKVGAEVDLNVGDALDVSLFQKGDKIKVSGVVKGRGFQGVIKRHGKSGGCSTHGSHFHRAPGSIGMCTYPGRVIKNMKLPGHMGTNNKTIKNVKVVEIDVENNLMFVKGAVPGCNTGLLKITNDSVKLSERFKKKETAENVAVVASES